MQILFQSTLPIREETNSTTSTAWGWEDFNPLFPYGKRPRGQHPNSLANLFQSTLPTRGETILSYRSILARMISIHSPHTGRDAGCSPDGHRRPDFNPLSPHGERRGRRCRCAPAGCHFNPLSPHGERLKIFREPLNIQNFNPLSPHGERPAFPVFLVISSRFQSTLPTRGETVTLPSGATSQWRFQSTLPTRGETMQSCSRSYSAAISIHSPHTGRDGRVLQGHAVAKQFQSTLPTRGETYSA